MAVHDILFGPDGAFVDDAITRNAVMSLQLDTETIEDFVKAVWDLRYCEMTSKTGAMAFSRDSRTLRWVALA